MKRGPLVEKKVKLGGPFGKYAENLEAPSGIRNPTSFVLIEKSTALSSLAEFAMSSRLVTLFSRNSALAFIPSSRIAITTSRPKVICHLSLNIIKFGLGATLAGVTADPGYALNDSALSVSRFPL